MKISKLDLDPTAIDFLISEGYEKLFPPQEQSVKAGLFDDKKNFLITIPTASGKTLIAMLAILSHLSKYKTKIVYLTPLRALTNEKFEEFKKLEQYSIRGKKIKVISGETRNETKFKDADVIFLTNESMDANMAFQQDWIYDIGMVVSDEIHLIGDNTRGPTLEIILTRLRSGFIGKNPPRIIGLSATISNSIDLADWLDCELVESTYRRVPLSEAVYSRHIIINQNREETEANLTKDREARHAKDHIGLGLETIDDEGQCLIFAMSRKNAAAWAVEAGLSLEKTLTDTEKIELEKISQKILRKEESENTKVIVNLAKAVKTGSAFHHAGLPSDCKEIVETEFKNKRIKFLTATPTLAAGVNLPARRVILPSVMRYTNGGLEKISILEYKQMCGRAGRPQYDDMGESIIVAKGYPDEVLEYYVDGTPEPLESQILENESSMRINILGFIINTSKLKSTSLEKIIKFFSHTFASHNLDDKDKLKKIIKNHLDSLKEYGMITDENGFEPTSIGNHVFKTRLDPKTAFDMHGYLEEYVRGQKHTFGILHMITNLDEFIPKQLLYKTHLEEWEKYVDDQEKLFNGQNFVPDENCYKSLCILCKWIENATYKEISNDIDADPGDVFFTWKTTQYLLEQFIEIIKFWRDVAEKGKQKKIVNEYQSLIDESKKLSERVEKGIREKYLELTKIRGIGRVRAQILYKNGYKDKTALKKVSLDKLAAIDKIGMILAKSIKSQVEKKVK